MTKEQVELLFNCAQSVIVLAGAIAIGVLFSVIRSLQNRIAKLEGAQGVRTK